MFGRTQVAWGELGEAPLEALCSLSGAVVLPLLSSPAAQAGWSEAVAFEVADTLRKLSDNGVATLFPNAGQLAHLN